MRGGGHTWIEGGKHTWGRDRNPPQISQNHPLPSLGGVFPTLGGSRVPPLPPPGNPELLTALSAAILAASRGFSPVTCPPSPPESLWPRPLRFGHAPFALATPPQLWSPPPLWSRPLRFGHAPSF